MRSLTGFLSSHFMKDKGICSFDLHLGSSKLVVLAQYTILAFVVHVRRTPLFQVSNVFRAFTFLCYCQEPMMDMFLLMFFPWLSQGGLGVWIVRCWPYIPGTIFFAPSHKQSFYESASTRRVYSVWKRTFASSESCVPVLWLSKLFLGRNRNQQHSYLPVL